MHRKAVDTQRVALYARLSKSKGEDDTTVERQLDIAREFVTAKGWSVVSTYIDEDRSASKIGVTREGFERLLADMAGGAFDAVVFYRQDRLFRDPYDYGRFWRQHAETGVAFYGVRDGIDSTSTFAPMLSAVGLGQGQTESSTLGQRTRDKLAENARQGKSHGGVRSFGYREDMRTPHDTEAPIVRELYQRFLAGESAGDLVRDMREREIVGTRGRPLSVQTLTGILTNPRYAGLRTYKGEILDGVDAKWEPLVDRATWEASAARLSAPSRKRSAGHSARKHLLSGLMQCGLCGTTIQSRPNRRTHRYGCPGGVVGQGCGRVFISGDGADTVVGAAVLAELSDPAVIKQIQRAASKGPDAGLLQELQAAEARKVELLDLYREGVLDKAEFTTERRLCEDHVEAVRARLSAQDDAGVLAAIPTNPEALAAAWNRWTLARRRAVVSAVVESIKVMPGRRGYKGVDPNRLKITYRG